MHALIFTACYSRHMFVWLSFTQTLAAFIAGCEAAWVFFGGVFKVLVPDNAGLVRRYGPGPVDTACAHALELDVVNVTKIASMLEKATENTVPPPGSPATWPNTGPGTSG